MPGDWQPVVPKGALEIVFRVKRFDIGLLGLLREYSYPALPPNLSDLVRRGEACHATANDRHRAEQVLALTGMSSCFRGAPFAKSIVIPHNRILEQRVESGSRRCFGESEAQAHVSSHFKRMVEPATMPLFSRAPQCGQSAL